MPVWLQVTLPFVTLVLGFILGRVNKALDRRLERRNAERASAPRFVIERMSGELYRLVNEGEMTATAVRSTCWRDIPESSMPSPMDLRA